MPKDDLTNPFIQQSAKTEDILTATEVAILLRVRPSTVDAYRRRGVLAYIELGPRVFRYRREDVDDFVNRSRQSAR